MSMRYPGGLIATTPVNQQFPSGVWTGPQSAPYQTNNVWGNDPYFKNTSLLLQGGGSVAPFIKDTSTNNFNISISGDTRADSKTPFTPPSGITTYGSGYFDGSGDTLNTISDPAFGFGSGAWTFEAWVYPTASQTDNWIIATNDAGKLRMRVGASGYLSFYTDTGNISLNSTTVVTVNAWSHVAICYDGTTLSLFQNGTRTATSTASISNGSSNACYIGSNTIGGSYWNGYISNARVVKGSAVYSGATYTVPTSPLATIANTSLLTLQSNVPVNNNVFIDSSTNNYAITRTGSITQGSFTPYNPGYYSNYFDGNGDYLSFATGQTPLLLSSSDFTCEAWVLKTSGTGTSVIFCGQSDLSTVGGSSYVFYISGSGATSDLYIGGSGYGIASPNPDLNTWSHVAWVRTGGVYSSYLNGVRVATRSDLSTGAVNNGSTSYAPSIGAFTSGGNTLTGYISNLRLIKGNGGYNANNSTITVPTAPLTAVANTSLLTCQSNRFLDNSTNAFSVTKTGDTNVQALQPFAPPLQYTTASFSGSGYFFGASNSLQTPSGTCPVINDFSASGWVYRTSVPGYQQTFIAMGLDGPGRVGFFWTGSNFEYNIYGSSTVTVDGSGSMPVGAWTYVVLTRTGSTITLYYNGVLKATVSQGTAFSASSGRAMSWMDGTIGYATNLRFDTAAYSSPTTVPTAPVSYTANTNNLLNFTNTGIVDNAMQNDLVTVGDVKLNTSVVKYGTGSMYFDGTGDYLQTATSPNLSFGSGNFTMEMWFYQAGARVQSYPTLLGNNTSWAANLWDICVDRTDSAGKVTFFVYNVSSTNAVVTSASTIAQNTWYHLALVRNGSTMLLFLNGVLDATGSISTTSLDTGNNYSIIGSQGGSTTMFAGYIDDLRITKGVARYTGNFTPPVARMPNQ